MTIQERPIAASPGTLPAHDQLILPERRSRLSSILRNRAFGGVFRYPPSLIATIILAVVLLGATIGPSLLVWNPTARHSGTPLSRQPRRSTRTPPTFSAPIRWAGTCSSG